MKQFKILIQNRETKLFYKGPRNWVADPDSARIFSTALTGYNFASEQGLGDVEIVFKPANQPVRSIIAPTAYGLAA